MREVMFARLRLHLPARPLARPWLRSLPSLSPQPLAPRLARPLAGLLLLAGTACNQHQDTEKRSEAQATEAAPASAAPTTTAAPTAASSQAPGEAARATAKRRLPLAALGGMLYAQYCKLCHGPTGEGYVADNAPSLVSQSFLESASDEFIASGIRMGRPNTAMAAYGRDRGGPLSDVDIKAIVQFIRSRGADVKTLPTPQLTGDAKRGQQVYLAQCVKCHGDSTHRGTAPALHNPEFLAAASPAFLQHAIVNGRPPTPMLPFGKTLRPEQIADILAYLKSLAPTAPTQPIKAGVPKDLAMVINPKGAAPSFTLRSDRFVSADQVKTALDKKQRLILIDARSPADWIQFHIPGSVPIPYYDAQALAKIPDDGTWVVAYCACPHHASGEVVDALRKRGYKHTAVLDEGILVWKDRGYALAGEAVK